MISEYVSHYPEFGWSCYGCAIRRFRAEIKHRDEQISAARPVMRAALAAHDDIYCTQVDLPDDLFKSLDALTDEQRQAWEVEP